MDTFASFAGNLSPAMIASDAEHGRYEQGARYGGGQARAVLRPTSAEEVREIIRASADWSSVLVPQGANTGLVGASTPDGSGDQIVISLDRMRHILSIDPDERTATVEPGVRLSELNAALAQHDLYFPIDLGADPSVGGMIATNTGGARHIRYGDVRANVLGLQVVLPDQQATILDLGANLRKDNSGPDLKHLFIGTGGAFGIITQSTLNLAPIPNQRSIALLVPSGLASVPSIVRNLERRFGEMLSAIEGMSREVIEFALQHMPRLHNPFSPDPTPEYVILVEISTSVSSQSCDIDDALQHGLEALLVDGLIENAVIDRHGNAWELRHALSEGLRAAGTVLAFDIALPRSALPQFRTEARALIRLLLPDATLADFGHIGDGGLHLNFVLQRDKYPKVDTIEVGAAREAIFDLVVSGYGGTFSGEHGLGPANWSYYERFRPAGNRAVDRRLAGCLGLKHTLGNLPFS